MTGPTMGMQRECPLRKRTAELLLEPDGSAELDQHIETCGSCRELVDAQRAVWESLDLWTPAEVSPDFDARLYARIAQEDAAPQWKQWLRRIFEPPVPLAAWKPAISLAAIAAVLVAGLVIRPPQPTVVVPQAHSERVDILQVEQALEDLDILTPAAPAI